MNDLVEWLHGITMSAALITVTAVFVAVSIGVSSGIVWMINHWGFQL